MASDEHILRIRHLLTLMEKTHKTMRLYQSSNEVSRRLGLELGAALGQILDAAGELVLKVSEKSLSVDGEAVYQASDRTDSLAFLFYRDGIRSLSFLPGLEQPELRGFMDALVLVSVVANQADDLVTLFWERDFSHIKYVAVEELAEQASGPSIAEQLAHGSLAGEGTAGAAAPTVSISELERPLARMPIHECVLSEEEVESLRLEFAREEEDATLTLMVDLAVELTLQEAGDRDNEALVETLLAVLERAMREGRAATVAVAVARLVELLRRFAESSAAAADLRQRIVRRLAQPEVVEAFLSAVERDVEPPSAGELSAYLQLLGSSALPAMVTSLGSLRQSSLRRVVADTVVRAGNQAVEVITRRIASRGVPEKSFLDGVIYVARRLEPAAGIAVVRSLLATDRPAVRRQAALAMGPYQEGAIGAIWVELLLDEDPEMRKLAVTALLRGGRPELAQPIAECTMNPAFGDYALEEKERYFAAVARLKGPACAQWMAEILWQPRRSHFLSKPERELIQSVVHGLAQLPPRTARSAFKELIESGDRHVRAACRKALKEMGDG